MMPPPDPETGAFRVIGTLLQQLVKCKPILKAEWVLILTPSFTSNVIMDEFLNDPVSALVSSPVEWIADSSVCHL